MSRTIVKHSWTNPVTKTRHIRYDKSFFSGVGEFAGLFGLLPFIALAGFIGLIVSLLAGENKEKVEQPKVEPKVEKEIDVKRRDFVNKTYYSMR